MLGECLMICLSFTATDRTALEAERYLYSHPKVQRKLEAVYLKSLGLPHHLICRICQISKPTLVRYLRVFEQAGLEGLKQLGYEGRPQRSASARGEFGAALSPESAVHLCAGPSGDRRTDGRAAGVDPGAGFPARA